MTKDTRDTNEGPEGGAGRHEDGEIATGAASMSTPMRVVSVLAGMVVIIFLMYLVALTFRP